MGRTKNDCFPPHRYDPKMKDFSVNTWNRVNEFTLPHGGESDSPSWQDGGMLE
jgi:hypothetical protein